MVTIPAGVGPVRARVTTDAMALLTGDGGSMNPPPPFIADNVGWWNFEHFDPSMPLVAREKTVRDTALFELSSMGPYGVHEGMPGHHLQLSIARLGADYSKRRFHDELLALGSVPYVFARAEMLGEPVPDF